MVFKSETQRRIAVGMAKKFYDEGKTTQEIAKLMCLSESQVRSLKKIIDDAEKNK